MSKKKKKHGEEEGGEAWLLPYSDLMTLLLAVFIVLFAVSQVDVAKSEAMAAAFNSSMMTQGAGIFSGTGEVVLPLEPDGQGGDPAQTGTTTESTTEESTASEQSGEAQQSSAAQQSNEAQSESTANAGQAGQAEQDNLLEVEAKLNTLLKDEKMSSDISTVIDERGLVISLNNAILFDSGSAEIKTDHKDTLYKIAGIINRLDNYIRIEGHTDNRPINTKEYPSNWELSTSRAVSVVRLFIDFCNVSPEKVVAVGYGEYRPVADNSTEEGRAKNRRIDIIVLSEKFNSLENQ